MVWQDKSAFLEILEVEKGGKQTDKRRRQLVDARLQVHQLTFEVRMTEETVKSIEHELDAAAGFAPPRPTRTRRGTPPVTERDLKAARARLTSKRRELAGKESRLERLEKDAHIPASERRPVMLCRLHSGTHYVECSEKRFQRWSIAQRATPIWLTTQDGRRWWWYLDRFWWDDEGLSAEEIVDAVLEVDLEGEHQREALQHMRTEMFRRGSIGG